MPSEAAKSKREMTPERWQQVRDLLAPAIRLPAAERPGYFDSVCQGDAPLRAELESLIAAHEIAEGGNFEQPALDDSGPDERERELFRGRRIGAYRIEAEIAHGGMGTVYRALRADDEFKKQVAIKVVDRAALSSRSAELFRHERQILAGLEHPNIARLLDGGTMEDGVPYLVMEYVEGESITRYCDSCRLSIEERLKLFRKICAAVHFAHQNLVIHRDIKPANILVTRGGEPKLLDFGIAKMIDATAAGDPATMTMGAMTPAYASPEQLNGLPVTTATDIYSLGLVLYELLTGKYAYESFASPVRRQQAIVEEDPERPSQAVLRQSLAAHEGSATAEEISGLRQLSVEKLSKRLRGDLESIVQKAIRKEPTQRYGSVEQLADDTQRHLDGLPVLAHGDTWDYRLRKLIKRHRAAALATGLVFATLIVAVVVTAREARIARVQQARAERRFSDVRKLANSLIFEVHDSIRSLPGATGARKLIVQRAQEYLDSLAADSKSDPSLLRELAAAYTRLGDVLGDTKDANLGNSEQSFRDYRRSAELREAVVAASPADPDSRRELAQSYMSLALAFSQQGKTNSEKEFLGKAMSLLEPLAASHPGDPKIQFALAKACERKGQESAGNGQWVDARASYEKSLAIYRRLAEADPKNPMYLIEVAFAHKHMGGVLIMQNQLPAALEEYRAALPIDEARIKAAPQDAINRYAITFTYSDTGYILRKLGDIDGALAYYRKALDIRSALAAADPQDMRARGGLANTYNYMADLLHRKGDLPGALRAAKQALSIRQALSESDPANQNKRLGVAFSQGSVGDTYVNMAFQPHTAGQRQMALCRQAEFWLQKALPELQQRKNLLQGTEISYPAQVQKAANRCDSAISRLSRGNQFAAPVEVP